MSRNNVSEILIDVPVKMCRNMSHEFIDDIMKEKAKDLSLHHFMILKLLNENDSLYVTEVVDCLGIPRSQMTASADKLIASGYITRVPDIEDRRKINLFITEKGKLLTDKIVTQIHGKVEKILSLLTAKEIKVLEDGLEVLMKVCSLCKETESE